MPKVVPQGSILGPLLCSINANDLPLQVKHCQIHMYSDDEQLYMGCSSSDATQLHPFDKSEFESNLFMGICK